MRGKGGPVLEGDGVGDEEHGEEAVAEAQKFLLVVVTGGRMRD